MPDTDPNACTGGTDGTVTGPAANAGREVSVRASSGGRSLDRESITSGHTEAPVNFYRCTDPPLFAGFQMEWVSGTDDKSGTTFMFNSGAGMGSRYATLRVEIPGGETVYEYIDVFEIIEARVAAIIAEQGVQRP